MAKVCLITVCDSLNYGTLLQVYSLYNVLQKRYGVDVSLVLNDSLLTLKRDLKFIKRKRIKVLLKKVVLLIRFKIFENKLTKGKKTDKYEIAIVGSDELWNIKNKMLIHDGLYLARGINADIIVSYAVSCNGCVSEEINRVYGEKPLSEFDCLSVRDKSTEKLVREYGKQCVRVLDPTFLYDFTPHISNVERDVVLVYGYWFTDEEIEQIIEFAKKVNKKIVAIGNDFHWCSNYVGGNPFTFVDYVKNASYFITSTFHGSAIAIQMHANFVSFARDNMKVVEILEEFYLDSRNASNRKMETIFQDEINYEKIDKIIESKRNYSFDFLDKVMSKNIL